MDSGKDIIKLSRLIPWLSLNSKSKETTTERLHLVFYKFF